MTASESDLDLVVTETGVRLRVRAQPGSARNEVKGLYAGALKIAVTAKPDRGRANDALVEYLATVFGVSKSRVHLLHGQTSRDKLVLLEGLGAEDVRQRLRTEERD